MLWIPLEIFIFFSCSFSLDPSITKRITFLLLKVKRQCHNYHYWASSRTKEITWFNLLRARDDIFVFLPSSNHFVTKSKIIQATNETLSYILYHTEFLIFNLIKMFALSWSLFLQHMIWWLLIEDKPASCSLQCWVEEFPVSDFQGRKCVRLQYIRSVQQLEPLLRDYHQSSTRHS